LGEITVVDKLTTRQAAAKLGVPVTTLMSWIYDRKIPATRWGRYWQLSSSDVEAFAERRR